MKTRHLVLLFLLPGFGLFAQESGKGVAPLASPPPSGGSRGEVRAVVVGISDYQHSAIPDLQFADRDAEKFAEWLQSKAGGSIPADNITLLTNENATLGKFAMALDALLDNCNAGDQAIIYFSGHGDVERKTISQPGYLLCRDAPATCYMSGGAFNLRDLQDVITTLSLQKNVHVLVITDACHAGKLAGNPVSGTQITSQHLTTQFANEVKILSCQPNEYSLEGAQWGDGRGVFSFCLIKGLTGLADRNNDGMVTLFEIGRYLEDAVPAETAQSQLPQVAGEKQTLIARVDAPTLAQLLVAEKNQSGSLGSVGMKGLETDVLAKADSSDRRKYQAFKAALAAGNLLAAAGDPGAGCADLYYTQLIRQEVFAPLAGVMTRNFAAALIDEVQQAINALLDNDPYEANNWQYRPEKYSRYPDYLQRAIELLGENHYLYRSLMSKKRYFEGYNVAKTLAFLEKEPLRRDSLRETAKALYLEGIAFEPDAAYLYHAIGDMYFNNNPFRTDSLVLWCGRAAERSPGWIVPLLRIYDEYVSVQVDKEQAEKWLLRALQILPDSYLAQERLGFLRYYQGRRDEALGVAQKMIAEKPELFNAYTLMACIYYYLDGDYPAAERAAEKSVERNPAPGNWVYNFWAGCYAYLHPLPEAVDWLKQRMNVNSGVERGYQGAFLVEALSRAKRYDEAETYARQLLAENLPFLGPTAVWYAMGKMRMQQNRVPEAADCFQKSLASDPTPDPIFVADLAWLGEIAYRQHRDADARSFFEKAVAYDSGFGEEWTYKEEAWYRYGNFLLRRRQIPEAAACFQKSLDLRSKGFWGEYGFALLAAQKGRETEALDWLEKALDNFYPDLESIWMEPLFKKIKKTKRFREMLTQHSPPGWENR